MCYLLWLLLWLFLFDVAVAVQRMMSAAAYVVEYIVEYVAELCVGYLAFLWSCTDCCGSCASTNALRCGKCRGIFCGICGGICCGIFGQQLAGVWLLIGCFMVAFWMCALFALAVLLLRMLSAEAYVVEYVWEHCVEYIVGYLASSWLFSCCFLVAFWKFALWYGSRVCFSKCAWL
jgi:hypothetical protein